MKVGSLYEIVNFLRSIFSTPSGAQRTSHGRLECTILAGEVSVTDGVLNRTSRGFAGTDYGKITLPELWKPTSGFRAEGSIINGDLKRVGRPYAHPVAKISRNSIGNTRS